MLNLEHFAKDWTTLLEAYCTNGGEVYCDAGQIVHVNGRKTIKLSNTNQKVFYTSTNILQEHEITSISNTIVKRCDELNLPTLKKIKGAFDLFILHQTTIQNKEIPALNTFSARFSKWATSHKILATILCIVTASLLYNVWIDGDKINKKNADLQRMIQEFKSFSRSMEEKIKEKEEKASQRPEIPKLQAIQPIEKALSVPPPSKNLQDEKPKVENPQPYPKEILGLILHYLSTEERELLEEWDTTKEAMKRAEGFQWDSLRENQNKFISFLDPIEFSDEIIKIRNLKANLLTDKWFMLSRWDADIKKDHIEKTILSILELDKYNDCNEEELRQEVPEKIKKLLKDREFVLLALKHSIWVGIFIPQNLKEDREFVFTALKRNGEFLQYLSEDFKKNREIALAAVSSCGLALKYLPSFDEDYEIVLAAVTNNGHAIQYASKKLENNYKIVLAAASSKGSVLSSLPEQFKKNKEIVLAAVSNDGLVIKYASEDLQRDRDVVLAAVGNDGLALELLPSFNDDREIVTLALKRKVRCSMLKYVSTRLCNEEDIVLAAVQRYDNLEYAGQIQKNNKKVVMAAVKETGLALYDASKTFQDDKEVVLAAVNQDGWSLMYASPRLKKDREVVLAAVSQRGNAFFYADDEFKNNKTVVMAAVQRTGWALGYASKDLQDDKEVVLAAVNQDGKSLQYASSRLKKDTAVVLAAVSQNIYAFSYMGHELKNDKAFALKAISQRFGYEIVNKLSPDLQADPEVIDAANKSRLINSDLS